MEFGSRPPALFLSLQSSYIGGDSSVLSSLPYSSSSGAGCLSPWRPSFGLEVGLPGADEADDDDCKICPPSGGAEGATKFVLRAGAQKEDLLRTGAQKCVLTPG